MFVLFPVQIYVQSILNLIKKINLNTLCEVRELDDIKSQKISTNQLEFIRVTMTSFHLSPSQDYQKG